MRWSSMLKAMRLTSATAVSAGDSIAVEMRDGRFDATVGASSAPKPAAPQKRAKPAPAGNQGSLF